jgi:hypothetical protein
MTSIEDRLQRLEDIEDIRALKYRYAELCDDGYQPEGLADLFMPDGVWDGGDDYGRYEGREAIAGYWRGCGENIPFAIHYILNHVVEPVEPGRRATGRCSLFQPMTMEGKAYWAGVRYDEEYVKHDGAWRFATSRLTTLLLAPHEDGW